MTEQKYDLFDKLVDFKYTKPFTLKQGKEKDGSYERLGYVPYGKGLYFLFKKIGGKDNDLLVMCYERDEKGNFSRREENDKEVIQAILKKCGDMIKEVKDAGLKVTDIASYRPKNIMKTILDKANKEPILLTNEQGNAMVFEQVAVIPFVANNERRLYVILRLLNNINGLSRGANVVFNCDKDASGQVVFKAEDDPEVIKGIQERYIKLVQEAAAKNNKK